MIRAHGDLIVVNGVSELNSGYVVKWRSGMAYLHLFGIYDSSRAISPIQGGKVVLNEMEAHWIFIGGCQYLTPSSL